MTQEGRPENSMLAPASRRGADGGGDDPDATLGAEVANQFDVLHDADLREAADRSEDGCADEDGLVTIGQPPPGRSPVDQCLDPPEDGILVLDFQAESTSDRPWPVDRLGDEPVVAGRQDGIGVEEQAEVAPRRAAPAFIWRARPGG